MRSRAPHPSTSCEHKFKGLRYSRYVTTSRVRSHSNALRGVSRTRSRFTSSRVYLLASLKIALAMLPNLEVTCTATEAINSGQLLVIPLRINPSVPISTLIVSYQQQRVFVTHVEALNALFLITTCFGIRGCRCVGKVLITAVDAARSLLIGKRYPREDLDGNRRRFNPHSIMWINEPRLATYFPQARPGRSSTYASVLIISQFLTLWTARSKKSKTQMCSKKISQNPLTPVHSRRSNFFSVGVTFPDTQSIFYWWRVVALASPVSRFGRRKMYALCDITPLIVYMPICL